MEVGVGGEGGWSGRSERGEINWKERERKGTDWHGDDSTGEGSCVRGMRRRGEGESRGEEERSGAAGREASAEDINNLCSIKQSCVAKKKRKEKKARYKTETALRKKETKQKQKKNKKRRRQSW